VLPPEEPAIAIAAGDWNRVPVILGSNRDETRLFSLMDKRYARRWFGVLPRLRDETRFYRDTSYGSKLWKASAVDELARAMHASGATQIYTYRFDWDELATPGGTDLPNMLGAAHGLDLGFTFGSWDRGAKSVAFLVDEESQPGRESLASAMTSYWSEFAKTGNPGRGRDGALPEWRAWDESALDTPRLLVLDTEKDGGIRMSAEEISLRRIVDEIGGDPRFESRAERCAYLQELAPRNPRVVALGREVLSCGAAPTKQAKS
jgi:para-nitrobenzyl esterase